MVPYCVPPTVKHGGRRVTVCSSLAGSRVGDLHRQTGTLNQKIYHSISHHHTRPSGLCLIGQEFMLQHDNDPEHTSRLYQDYFTRKEQDNRPQTMELTAQSPDLTPIKLGLCNEVDRSMKAKQPTSAMHLYRTSATVWGRTCTYPSITCTVQQKPIEEPVANLE